METPGPQRTPLYDFHARNGAKFVDFAGWELPVHYGTGILGEHLATRQAAGLFDVSHMGEFLVSGASAEVHVDHLLTNNLLATTPGQALYSPACAEDGGVIDDLILYKLSADCIFICCNASNTQKVDDWLNTKLAASTCQVENQSYEYAQIAIQGPMATTIIKKVLPGDFRLPGRFRFSELEILGNPCILSRTGYTGEDGVEIYLRPEFAYELASALLNAGKDNGLIPAGLGARDSLRLEAGYPLYGHEISGSRTPVEGGIGWAVKLDKPNDFLGKETLLNQKNSPGSHRRTIHFITQDKRIVREGATLVSDGKPAGEVLSGSFSPVIQRGIGSASLNPSIPQDAPLAALVRNREIRIFPSKPPLHKASIPNP